MSVTPPVGVNTSDYQEEEPEYVPLGAIETVPGFHLTYPDNVPRYVCDYDGYETAYPVEARAHLVAIGYPNG